MFNKIKYAIDQIGGILLGISALLILFQVIMRYVFQSPNNWTEELARYISVWGTLIVSGLLVYEGGHITLDYFYEKFPAPLKKVTSLINNVLLIMFFTLFGLGGYRLMITSTQVNQMSPGLQIPMWIVYIVLPISGVLMILGLVFREYQKKKEGGIKQ
ncbi:MAG: TRAP transporter small permease [Bacillota bacterium]